MPPRFAYWTILVDNQPTAFRAGTIEDLMPTFKRLKERHASAVMMWFQNGRLWASRFDAREAMAARGRGAKPAPRPARRPATWRPGGTHEDPRQKYKDAKKAKWTRFKQAIRARHTRPAKPKA